MLVVVELCALALRVTDQVCPEGRPDSMNVAENVTSLLTAATQVSQKSVEELVPVYSPTTQNRSPLPGSNAASKDAPNGHTPEVHGPAASGPLPCFKRTADSSVPFGSALVWPVT